MKRDSHRAYALTEERRARRRPHGAEISEPLSGSDRFFIRVEKLTERVLGSRALAWTGIYDRETEAPQNEKDLELLGKIATATGVACLAIASVIASSGGNHDSSEERSKAMTTGITLDFLPSKTNEIPTTTMLSEGLPLPSTSDQEG